MPNLSIKDVPENWAEALRQRAARNHRSLQGELMALIERAVNAREPASHAPNSGSDGLPLDLRIVGYDSNGWPIVRHGTKTPEQVFAQMRESGVKPVRGQPLAVDILRRDRDSR